MRNTLPSAPAAGSCPGPPETTPQGPSQKTKPAFGTPASSPRFSRPELDALRFFAFALIFCDHVPIDSPWFYPIHEIGGFGVAIFFCLSAYLILTLLLREREHTGSIDVRAFAIRRILRILPLYLLTIAIGSAMGLYWPAIRLDPHYLLALLLMYANAFCAYYLWIGVGCLAPLWSISLEAQFYLVIPFVARLRRRTIALLCALVIAASYIFLLHFGRARFSPVLQAWPNTVIQFQFFAAGAAIALVLFRRHFAPGLFFRTALALAGLTLFYVAAIVCRIHSIRPIPTIHLLTGYLCELTGIIAIFLAVLHLPLKVASPLAYLGKISYGLYLFHAPLLWFAFSSTGPLSPSLLANRHPATTVLLVAAATIALAALSYEFFEKPILRLKQRFESEKTRI